MIIDLNARNPKWYSVHQQQQNRHVLRERSLIMEAWNGFKGTKWQETIDVRDFIINNHISYEGDGAFLEGATERTKS